MGKTTLLGVGVLAAGALTAVAAPASGADTATCDGKPATVVQTPQQADDAGTPGDDVVVIAADKITFNAWGGHDTVCVDPALSYEWVYVSGGKGTDRLFGGSGPDTIDGDAGADLIRGGPGDDELRGDNPGSALTDGADQVFGGMGNDVVRGDIVGASDTYRGGPGNDTLSYAQIGYPLGLLTIKSGFAIDVDAASDGDLTDADWFTGFEEYVTTPFTEEVHGSAGDDVIVNSGGDDLIFARAGDDVIDQDGSPGYATRGPVYGGPGDDIIRRDAFANVFHGGRGDDLLIGRRGADRLFGGPGDDVARGGRGQDHCAAEVTFRC